MYALLIVIHLVACLGLIVTVLLQAGKGSGLSGTFGAGSIQSAFGTQASDVMKKATTVLAVAFMLTSLSIAFISSIRSSSVMKSVANQKGAPSAQAQGQQKAVPVANQQSQQQAQQQKSITKKIVTIDPTTGEEVVVEEKVDKIPERKKVEPQQVVNQIFQKMQSIGSVKKEKIESQPKTNSSAPVETEGPSSIPSEENTSAK
ncbi:MAG: preprotein translocase subunit SecG [Candidatus Theseobacter exili]|nr:preprotein translocase subunit SecG [Candidatus Theseobacter exili]